MQRNLLLLILIPVSISCFSQKVIRIGSYVLPTEAKQENVLILEMPFGKSEIINIIGDTAALRNAGDIFIDVVFTDFPSNSTLEILNQKRLSAFKERFPFLMDSQFVQINCVRQLDGAEKEKAATMFHGLLVRFRPVQSVETMKEDVISLDKILTGKPTDTVFQKKETEKIKDSGLSIIKNGINTSIISKEEKSPSPPEIFNGNMGNTLADYLNFRKGIYDSVIRVSRKEVIKRGFFSKRFLRKSSYQTDSMNIYFFKNKLKETEFFDRAIMGDTPEIIYCLPDSTVFKILARTKWKNPAIIGDVTGSMYPYTAQLLLWLKLHSLDSLTTKFVFFNDGDNLPDKKKKIGRTGGIYAKQCNSFDEVKNLIKETMIKGGGGDSPENNVEALLLAEKEFPENDFQVLIADNWAPVKDKSLAMQLTKPVRIVLCGVTDYYVNIDYLNLARQTKGSVHLIEQDLYNLATMHEGEVLKIGKRSYKIKNGLFFENEESDIFKSL